LRAVDTLQPIKARPSRRTSLARSGREACMEGTTWDPKDITWVNLLLGIWLIVGLFALGVARLSPVALTNNIIIGVLVLAMSWWVISATAPPLGAAWFQVLCGLWLLVSPFVL